MPTGPLICGHSITRWIKGWQWLVRFITWYKNSWSHTPCILRYVPALMIYSQTSLGSLFGCLTSWFLTQLRSQTSLCSFFGCHTQLHYQTSLGSFSGCLTTSRSWVDRLKAPLTFCIQPPPPLPQALVSGSSLLASPAAVWPLDWWGRCNTSCYPLWHPGLPWQPHWQQW